MDTTTIKRGTAREDGKIFWCYNRGSEYWVTPERFKFNQERNGRWARENPKKHCQNALRWNRTNRDKFNENKKRFAKRHPDKIRNDQLRIKFGITLDQYNVMLANQNEVCAICKKQCQTGKYLAVDHCHKTKKVRGLLCMNCNNGLGKFKDSTETLTRAIEYLIKNSVDDRICF